MADIERQDATAPCSARGPRTSTGGTEREEDMEKSEIANEIRRVIRGELDDCERALKAGDTAKVFNRVIASDYP